MQGYEIGQFDGYSVFQDAPVGAPPGMAGVSLGGVEISGLFDAPVGAPPGMAAVELGGVEIGRVEIGDAGAYEYPYPYPKSVAIGGVAAPRKRDLLAPLRRSPDTGRTAPRAATPAEQLADALRSVWETEKRQHWAGRGAQSLGHIQGAFADYLWRTYAQPNGQVGVDAWQLASSRGWIGS